MVMTIMLDQGCNSSAINCVRQNGRKTDLIEHTPLLLKVITWEVVALYNPQGGLGGGMRDLAGAQSI
jgi:hypothetical protein